MPLSFRLSAVASTAVVSIVTSFLAATAEAQSLAPCGDIHVEANAQCEVIPPEASCEVECTPVSLQAACSARLEADCRGRCDAELPRCSGSCEASCTETCKVDPGKFDCSASCQARCGGECDGACEGNEDGAECHAACEATCAANCDASCDISLPEADCEAKCDASCEGSCRGEAELDCQISCQAEGYADCELEVQGGCKGDCMTKQGALFCDGQYVDHGDNLKMCVEALKARLGAEVEGYAEGSSECGGGKCSAEGSAGVSCAALPGLSARANGGLSTGLFALGVVLARRRRCGR